jgi:hypothetical protein
MHGRELSLNEAPNIHSQKFIQSWFYFVRGFIAKTSAFTRSAFFLADFAAQRTRYPRHFLFLPSLKLVPDEVSLCAFQTRSRQKKKAARRSSYARKKSELPRASVLPPAY